MGGGGASREADQVAQQVQAKPGDTQQKGTKVRRGAQTPQSYEVASPGSEPLARCAPPI